MAERHYLSDDGFVIESVTVDFSGDDGFVIYDVPQEIFVDGGAVVPGVSASGSVRVGAEMSGGAVVPSAVSAGGELYINEAIISGGAYAPSLLIAQPSVTAGGSVDLNVGDDTRYALGGAVVPGVSASGEVTFTNSIEMTGGAVVPGVRTKNINFRGGAVVLGVRVAHPSPRGIVEVSSYNASLSQVSRRPTTVVTMGMDECINECGVAPCYYSGVPCQKTLATCKLPGAYQASKKTETFCLNSTPVELDVITRPYLKSSKIHAQEILTSESLLVVAKAQLVFFDSADGDMGVDPYRVDDQNRVAASGSEQVSVGGTFFARFLRRHKYHKGRRVTVWAGFDTGHPDTLNGYIKEFTGVIDNVSRSSGNVTFTVKGLLQLTTHEIPRKTDGKLFLPLEDEDQFQLVPWSGVDARVAPYQTKYTTGLVRIGDEIVGYDSVELDKSTGITTFAGLTRGMYNPYGWSMAVNHEIDVGVQEAHFFGGHPMDIMRELLALAGIEDDEIYHVAFNVVKEQFMPGHYFAAVITGKVKVKVLLAELRRQTNTHVWQDEMQRINIRVLAPAYPWVGYRQINESANIIFKSASVDDQAQKRITRQEIHYDHLPTQDLKEGSFFQVVESRNSDSEHDYGHGEIKEGKPIFSRWIHKIHDGHNLAYDLSASIVDLFKDGEEKITFSVELKDMSLAVGEIIEIASALLPDDFGHEQQRRFMITRRERVSLGKYRYMAVATGLEGRWLLISPDDHPLEWVGSTAEQQGYGCISDDVGRAPDGKNGYKIY